MPPVRRWHPQDIIAEVRKTGSSIAALSRDNGYKSRTLQICIQKKRWPRGNAIIARHLGVSRHELWPDWYGPNDELLPLSGRKALLRRAA